jgi:hypothetical protein
MVDGIIEDWLSRGVTGSYSTREGFMKKYLLLLGVVGFIAACASTPKDSSSIDRGTHPAGFSTAPAAVLYIHENIRVVMVDDIEVSWENKDQRPQHVNLESGVRVFQVEYNDGKLKSISPVSLAARLEDGGSYLLKPVIDEDNVSFSIVVYTDGLEGEDTTLYLSRR